MAVDRLRRIYQNNGLKGIISKSVSDPTQIISFFSNSPTNFYTLETTPRREDVVTFVRPLLDVSDEDILTAWEEIRSDEQFNRSINTKLSNSDERPSSLTHNWRELLYVLVRLRKPSTVVETGVFDGLSSAYILRAMERNDSGQLISIDINDTSRMPPGIETVGWVVPDRYRSRWDLQLGDANELLPAVASEESIDMFLHDSLHTEEHMRFEFTTVVEAMDAGDVFVSDNVRFNNVFWEFAESNLDSPVFWKNTDVAIHPDGHEVDDRLGAGTVAT